MWFYREMRPPCQSVLDQLRQVLVHIVLILITQYFNKILLSPVSMNMFVKSFMFQLASSNHLRSQCKQITIHCYYNYYLMTSWLSPIITSCLFIAVPFIFKFFTNCSLEQSRSNNITFLLWIYLSCPFFVTDFFDFTSFLCLQRVLEFSSKCSFFQQ